jgi:hypothetical protein
MSDPFLANARNPIERLVADQSQAIWDQINCASLRMRTGNEFRNYVGGTPRGRLVIPQS